MPANLPPEYLEAEQRYRQAQTLQEKLNALKEMMALVPKHKGTEKLRVDLKRSANGPSSIKRFKNSPKQQPAPKRRITLKRRVPVRWS